MAKEAEDRGSIGQKEWRNRRGDEGVEWEVGRLREG